MSTLDEIKKRVEAWDYSVGGCDALSRDVRMLIEMNEAGSEQLEEARATNRKCFEIRDSLREKIASARCPCCGHLESTH